MKQYIVIIYILIINLLIIGLIIIYNTFFRKESIEESIEDCIYNYQPNDDNKKCAITDLDIVVTKHNYTKDEALTIQEFYKKIDEFDEYFKDDYRTNERKATRVKKFLIFLKYHNKKNTNFDKYAIAYMYKYILLYYDYENLSRNDKNKLKYIFYIDYYYLITHIVNFNKQKNNIYLELIKKYTEFIDKYLQYLDETFKINYFNNYIYYFSCILVHLDRYKKKKITKSDINLVNCTNFSKLYKNNTEIFINKCIEKNNVYEQQQAQEQEQEQQENPKLTIFEIFNNNLDNNNLCNSSSLNDDYTDIKNNIINIINNFKIVDENNFFDETLIIKGIIKKERLMELSSEK